MAERTNKQLRDAAWAKLEEDEGNALAHENYLLGQAVGWEDASSWLMEQAASLYRKRKDDEARFVRDLAKDAGINGEAFRAKINAEFPKQR